MEPTLNIQIQQFQVNYHSVKLPTFSSV